MSIQGSNLNSAYIHNMKLTGTQNIPNIPALPMMVVMFHMVFFILSQIQPDWTFAVIIINIFFFILGLWATHDQNSAQAVFWMLCVHVFGILIDIIVLGIYFPPFQDQFGSGATVTARTFQFSAAMVIINLLLKPWTVFVLLFLFWFRDGFGKVLATLSTSSGDNTYSSLDEAERT